MYLLPDLIYAYAHTEGKQSSKRQIYDINKLEDGYTMDKFFSNLGGGGDKKKSNNAKGKKDESDEETDSSADEDEGGEEKKKKEE